MEIRDISAVCITLDPNNENRAQKAISSIKKLGFKDVRFIQGVRGNDLTDEELKNMVSIRSYYEIKNGRYVHEAHSNKNSVGCYLAHLKAWKVCIDSNQPLAIFEDDFYTNKPKEYLEKSYKEAVDLNYDIYKIVHGSWSEYGKKIETLTPNTVRIYKSMGTVGYIITPKTAVILFSYASPIEVHVDAYIDLMIYFKGLRCFGPKERIEEFHLGYLDSEINHTSLKTYNSIITTPQYRSRIYLLFLIFIFFATFTFLYHRKKCKC